MLIISGRWLGLLQAGIALASDWTLFLALRFAQGLALPALLTALMTYVASTAPPDQVRQSLSWYIAATILGVYALGLGIFALPSATAAFGGMFVFCGGMFLIHTRLSGQINQLQHRHRGVVNGVYIAAYYFGGSLGS